MAVSVRWEESIPPCILSVWASHLPAKHSKCHSTKAQRVSSSPSKCIPVRCSTTSPHPPYVFAKFEWYYLGTPEQNGTKKAEKMEKTKALALLGQGISVICVAAELKVSRQAIYDLKKAAATVSEGATPSRKPGTRRKRLTSLRTDMMLKREAIANPYIYCRQAEEESEEATPGSNMHHPELAALRPESVNVPRRQEAPPHGCHAEEIDCILQAMLFSFKTKYQYTYLNTYIALYFRTPK